MSDNTQTFGSEPNPDQSAVNTLYYISFIGIAVWSLGIIAILIATTRFPAAF